MSEIIKPRIDLRQQQTIKCEKCDSKFFKEITMLKKVPKLLTGRTTTKSMETTY